MKQSRLDNFFNIVYKGKTKTISSTPNNTPIFNSIQNNTKINPLY